MRRRKRRGRRRRRDEEAEDSAGNIITRKKRKRRTRLWNDRRPKQKGGAGLRKRNIIPLPFYLHSPRRGKRRDR
jgi:hypothetical protein